MSGSALPRGSPGIWGDPRLSPFSSVKRNVFGKGLGPAVEGSHSEEDSAAERSRWPWEPELLPQACASREAVLGDSDRRLCGHTVGLNSSVTASGRGVCPRAGHCSRPQGPRP